MPISPPGALALLYVRVVLLLLLPPFNILVPYEPVIPLTLKPQKSFVCGGRWGNVNNAAASFVADHTGSGSKGFSPGECGAVTTICETAPQHEVARLGWCNGVSLALALKSVFTHLQTPMTARFSYWSILYICSFNLRVIRADVFLVEQLWQGPLQC